MSTDPFAVLAMAPTLDVAAIKRAYFAALQRCPPHRDPSGFQTIRGAYERLVKPGGAASAFLSIPPAAEAAALLRLQEKWGARIDAARESVQAERTRRETIDTFVACFSTRSWSDVVASTARESPRTVDETCEDAVRCSG